MWYILNHIANFQHFTLDALNNPGISQDNEGKIVHVNLQQLALSTEGNTSKRGDQLTAWEIWYDFKIDDSKI